jgi:hypothetical protein
MTIQTMSPARLQCHLSDQVLVGIAGGEQVHCLIQPPSDDGPEELNARGVYNILPPVEHPFLGRIALLTHLGEPAATLQPGGRSSVGSATGGVGGLTYTLSPAMVQHALAGGLTYTLAPGAAQSALAGHAASLRSLILTKGPLGGSNVVVITTGFDELMDLLKSSEGGTLQIVP